MPRFDDRLKNVLALIESNEHSNNDTVFRHICDILLQEGLWMDEARRKTLVEYLADYYVKASQAARMEIADITSRVADAPVEIIALIAADSDVVGNRLWDRVRLTGDDWSFMLPRLSRTALGRLRARMNLSDAVSVAVDREWRERIRRPENALPNVEDTARFLKGLTALVDEVPQASNEVLESSEADVLDMSAAVEIVEEESEASAAGGSSAEEHEASEPDQERQPESENEEPVADSWLPEQDEDTQESDIEPAELTSDDSQGERLRLFVSDPQVVELAAVRERIKLSTTEDTPADEATPEDVSLGDSPEVEDPKIQDILQRLRDFGTRSKALRETDQLQTSDSQALGETQEALGGTQDLDTGSASLFAPDDEANSHQEEEQDGAAPRGKSLSLFAPFQPSEPDERADTLDKKPVERVRGRLSVSGLSPVFGARWTTDRFGSLVEVGPYGIDMFGLPAQNTIGEILSSLFNIKGRRELDKLLSARRGFRDLKALSVVGEEGWSLSGVPVFDESSGIFLGFRGTASPDFEFAQSELEKAAKEQLPEQDNEDPVFDVTGLAHELKTPLNAIRGFAEMIQTQQLGETSAFARHRSAHIGRQAQRLSNVLDDLLLRSHAQTPDDEAEPAPKTPILEILTSALADFESQHVLTERMSQLDPGLATPIDQRLAGRMIERLVFYAAQWTPAERPVTLRFNPPQGDDSVISITVRLPGWNGSNTQDDLLQVSHGPRLSYNHPLSDASLEGRSLPHIQEDLEAVGARLELVGGGCKPVSLSLVLPVSTK